MSAPDYEMPADADGDNEYMVTVKAEAGGEMAMQAVNVMVTNVVELGMLTADMESPISHPENSIGHSGNLHGLGRHHGRHGHVECGRR